MLKLCLVLTNIFLLQFSGCQAQLPRKFVFVQSATDNIDNIDPVIVEVHATDIFSNMG